MESTDFSNSFVTTTDQTPTVINAPVSFIQFNPGTEKTTEVPTNDNSMVYVFAGLSITFIIIGLVLTIYLVKGIIKDKNKNPKASF